MVRKRLKNAISQVGQALRDPEEFALRWHRGEALYGIIVWVALGATAVAGTMTFGMTLGTAPGHAGSLESALELTIAAGLAWGLSLPALYILNSLSGSGLPASTTVLAVLVTTSWGGLAMIASVPIQWFFTAAVPVPWILQIVTVAVFSAVGVAMIDVFGRLFESLEPGRGRRPAWCLLLVAAIGTELFHAFELFQFTAGK